jgi:hypothetical protein
VWVDFSAHIDAWGAWRRAAETQRLPLDAALSLLVERKLLTQALEEAGVSWGDLARLAEQEMAAPRLGPTPELRAWVITLNGAARSIPPDELPEAVMPQRVLVGLRAAGTHVADLAWDEVGPTARIDTAATLAGLTMEGWVLRRLLRWAARG